MFQGEVELFKSKTPTLRLVHDMSCNVGVEAGGREHVQDVLVVDEHRELSACCEHVRKSSDT